jgi:exopolysaccharide production protein ExoF
MPAKPYVIASVATALVSLLAMSATASRWHGSSAHAADRPAGVEAGRAHGERPSALAAGRLVRLEGAAACQSRPQVDMAELETAMVGQLVHMARLEAEIQGRDEIVLPEQLRGQEGAAAVANALHEEQVAFVAHKETLASQLATLSRDKSLVEREIEYTQKKEDAIEHQEALLVSELNNIDVLPIVKRGLAVSSQKLALEQNISQVHANRLDTEFLILKAQREGSKLDRTITDLRNQMRTEALMEYSKSKTALAALTQQARAVAAANAADAAARCDGGTDAVYMLVPDGDGTLRAFPVGAKGTVEQKG